MMEQEAKLSPGIAKTPEPPYYAVIFTSLKTEEDEGYAATADEMVRMVEQQPGFLGFESAREGVGITISYWESLEAIKAWKQQEPHVAAQQKGIGQWYAAYKTRICLVERDYGFERKQ